VPHHVDLVLHRVTLGPARALVCPALCSGTISVYTGLRLLVRTFTFQLCTGRRLHMSVPRRFVASDLLWHWIMPCHASVRGFGWHSIVTVAPGTASVLALHSVLHNSAALRSTSTQACVWSHANALLDIGTCARSLAAIGSTLALCHACAAIGAPSAPVLCLELGSGL
jgi:hypothetical protein